MSELLHNPKIDDKSIIPRKKPLAPKASLSISDLSASLSKDAEPKKVSKVTYDTTIRMNNHIKNFIKAMTILGMTRNQQEALETLERTYLESLSDAEQKTLTSIIETLEAKDARFYGKDKK